MPLIAKTPPFACQCSPRRLTPSLAQISNSETIGLEVAPPVDGGVIANDKGEVRSPLMSFDCVTGVFANDKGEVG